MRRGSSRASTTGTTASETRHRFLVYTDPRGSGDKLRRINFWYYKAPNLNSPYLYFDASRGSAAEASNDPPAATQGVTYGGPDGDLLAQLTGVHAIKRLQDSAAATKPFPLREPEGKFQILHAGVDDEWGVFPDGEPGPAGHDRS